MDAVRFLREFCSLPNQRFVCESGGQTFVASITHTIEPPATPDELAYASNKFARVAPELIPFYSKANGFTLFQDTLSDTAGVYLVPISVWEELTEHAMQWLEDRVIWDPESVDEEMEEALSRGFVLPAWVRSAIAIGGVSNSGNYFLLATEGDTAGCIYYSSHEDGEPEFFASSLGELVARFVFSSPPRMLLHLGCYARYSDGKTITQWIPEQFQYGSTAS